MDAGVRFVAEEMRPHSGWSTLGQPSAKGYGPEPPTPTPAQTRGAGPGPGTCWRGRQPVPLWPVRGLGGSRGRGQRERLLPPHPSWGALGGRGRGKGGPAAGGTGGAAELMEEA